MIGPSFRARASALRYHSARSAARSAGGSMHGGGGGAAIDSRYRCGDGPGAVALVCSSPMTSPAEALAFEAPRLHTTLEP